MTEHEYRSSPGVSQSELKKILISPAHYRWAKLNPLKQTEAVLMGTYLHAMVLEGQTDFNVRPNLSFATKEGKAWLSFRGYSTLGQYEDACGKMITEENYQQLCGMRDSLLAHPFVGPIIGDPATQKEVSGVGSRERFPDFIVKGRADIIFTDGATGKKIGADIKKVSKGEANPRSFLRMACDEDRELAFQAAYYTDIFGLEGFLFIVVEDEPYELASDGKTNVHRVEVYQVNQETIDFGRTQYQRALATLAECVRTDTWPGQPRDTKWLIYPDWKMAVCSDF